MPRTPALRAHAFVLAVACAAAFTATSCDVFGGLASPADSDAALVRFVEPVNGTLDLSLYATASGRNAYVVFTTGDDALATTPIASQKSSTRVPSPPATGRPSGAAEKASDILRAKARATAASSRSKINPRMSSTGEPTADYPGLINDFYILSDDSGMYFGKVSAVCMYASGSMNSGDAVDAVDFGGRKRTLSVYVAQNCTDGSKKYSVTQVMVDALAEKFFGKADSPTESIYAWVTNILGDEWGEHDSPASIGLATYDLIPPTQSITILLADVSADDSDSGGIIGYFYPPDTFLNELESNERVMFTIDAIMFANPDDEGNSVGADEYYNNGWTPSDYWAKEAFSTLAHEFQHMIHFYQKGVKLGGDYFGEPTWIDELCSMQVEDLLADKMGVPGPRGVDPDDGTAGSRGNYSGRLPEYLLWPDVSPLDWDNAPDDELTRYYSWAYSFGAYLTRNYGGAEFIRRVVQSSSADASAVVAAASAASGRDESMDSLLRRWGAAVLLSRRTDAPAFYRYNTGDYTVSTVGGLEYRLGSINMYNYVYFDGIDSNDADNIGDEDLTGPWVYESTFLDDMSGGAYSNAFMDLGDPSDGHGWIITVPAGMFATIVID